MDPKVVGYGTYGCVTKPSLECKSKNPLTKTRVSKLMHEKSALEEKKEMEVISKIKGIEKYVIKVPEICVPKKDDNFKKIFEECQGYTHYIKLYKYRPQELRLLLLEDGGVSVHDYIYEVLHLQKIEDQKIFFTNILNLFEGLKFFKEHDIIHQDLKSSNLVYNASTGVIKFIDFGMATKISKYIKKSKENRNRLGVSHSYYPPETSCTNVHKFRRTKKCKQYRERTSSQYPSKMNHAQFIDIVANTFDTYCLTFDLYKRFNHLLTDKQNGKGFSQIPSDFFVSSRSLMAQYCFSDLLERKVDLNALYNDYKSLLIKHHMYSRKTPSALTPEISSVLDSMKLSMYKTPISLPLPRNTKPIKPCPPGKERNPATNRCRKIQNNVVTNVNRRNTRKKQRTPLSKRPCPPGKERNPVTKRCRKIAK